MPVLNIVKQQGGDKLEDIALGGFQKIINQLSPKPIVTLGDQQDFINALRNTGLVNDISELQNLSVSDFINLKKALALEMDDTPITINFDEFRTPTAADDIVDIIEDVPVEIPDVPQTPPFQIVSEGVVQPQPKKFEDMSFDEARAYTRAQVDDLIQSGQQRSIDNFASLPVEVQEALRNMPIRSRSRLNKDKGLYEEFDLQNDYHVNPLPYEIPDEMLKAIEEGRMSLPRRYSDDFFNIPYQLDVINRIASKTDDPVSPFSDDYFNQTPSPFSIQLLADDIRTSSLNITPFYKRNTFDNADMNNQKVILDAYTNFKIRKQDYLDKQVNPASSFADNFYIDGSVNPSTFQKYLNYKNQVRKELQNGNMDPEFDPENIGASLNKYLYTEELFREPEPVNLKNLIVMADDIPGNNVFNKDSKIRNEYYEPFFYTKQEEALYEKFRSQIKGLQRGHELMKVRRIEIFNKFGKDNRILNHVKYPRFFTNPQRNGIHRVLENAIFENRSRFRDLEKQLKDMPYLPDSAKQSFRNEQKKIKQTLKDISYDMKQLGLVTQVINDNGKGYKTYGKGFTNPEQLMKSINEEQTFRFLTSKMSTNVASDRIEDAAGMPSVKNYLIAGMKDGGLVSVEEMLGSDNG
tara:strand:+ start:126 stop:2030 length:1905 start_codon:yes stop_codon:yes gene_type:complete